uniref:Putative secreted protein n=1 Tax=Ixodes scapularis TaxID=6945 RepID=Q4PMY8_IXOSC|nr:putative secreted protein [Ixodes scapularis]
MKNTGHLFFIMRTTRLILAMFVLFTIRKPTVASVAIRGAEYMAPNCETKIKDLCKNTSPGELQEVTVSPHECKVTCTYRPHSEPDIVVVNDMLVRNRKHEQVTLPEGMPCAFGAICDSKGRCICEFCNKNINNNMPR